MNWKALHETPMERRARRIWLALRIGFLLLIFAGIFGLVSGCETVAYINCVLKGNC